ncbi:hypothetical protein R3P38DRAFT_3299114 [Favolaschia claudopus]|uniref:Uncharacterized protein n=1 Tax=Favolaschia claudopus TaxID=2862362 RepID=A0AAV9Z1H9_9AGAR
MNVASLLQDSPSDRRTQKQDTHRWPQQSTQQQQPQQQQQKASWPPPPPQPAPYPYRAEPYPRQPPPPANPSSSSGAPGYMPPRQHAAHYPSPPSPGPPGPQAYSEPSPMYAPMGALRQPRDHRDRDRDRDRDRERDHLREREMRERERDRDRDRDFAPHSPHPSLAWPRQQEGGSSGPRAFQGQFHTSFVSAPSSPPRVAPPNSKHSSVSVVVPISGNAKREREHERIRERERDAYNSWGVPAGPPGMTDAEWELHQQQQQLIAPPVAESIIPVQQPPPPPQAEIPRERVFRAKKTINLGTYVYPNIPFPYTFPPPAATTTKSTQEEDPTLLALDTRATLLFPSAHLPSLPPKQGRTRLWGGALPDSVLPSSSSPPKRDSRSTNDTKPATEPAHRRLYTDDSDPVLAAVHAGWVTWSVLGRARREGRDVRVEVRVVRVLGRDNTEIDSSDDVTEAVGRFVGGLGARCGRGWEEMVKEEATDGERVKMGALLVGKKKKADEEVEIVPEKVKESEQEKEKKEAEGEAGDEEEGEIREEETEAEKEKARVAAEKEKEKEAEALREQEKLEQEQRTRDVEMAAVQEKEKEKEVKVEETEKKTEEDQKDDPSDDGRTLLSAGWGAGHDGSAFEILGVWVEGGRQTQGHAHSRTIQNRAQRLAEYGARRAELGCGPFPSTTTTTCTSPLCPAGRKRRTRPWERASPPTRGANGSVLGVVWEVDEGREEEGCSKEKGGREKDERSMRVCACVAALGKDRTVLKGRSVVCGFGLGGCVGFKYDADAVRRVLFPEPEPLIPDDSMLVDSIAIGRRVHALKGAQTDEVEEDGERPPPRKRRRVSGLEDVYAAAFEGEGEADVRVRDGEEEKGERQEEEEEEGKMVVEPGEGEGKEGGKGAEKDKDKDKDKDKEREAESAQAPQEESPVLVVMEQPIEKEKPKLDMRDVQLTTADGKLLVFSRVDVAPPPPSTDYAISPSAPPATTSSSSPHPQDESRWDVARIDGGSTEVLHRRVGKEEVDFAEGGVRFRGVVGGDGKEGMAVDGDTKMNIDADANWRERMGVVLWRYGS